MQALLDSNCWGQDISNSNSKSIENTRLSLSFFKTMASKEKYAENFMMIGCSVQKLSTVEDCKKYKKPWFLCDKH